MSEARYQDLIEKREQRDIYRGCRILLHCVNKKAMELLGYLREDPLLEGALHTRFYFDEHDILVLPAPGALGRTEKPIFVDNF
jgi:hypothetical protein